MHVGGIPVDLNWFLQFVFTLFLIAGGLLYVVKNTASRYFEVDASFESAGGTADRNRVVPVTTMESPEDSSSCDNCGKFGTRKCSRCKSVRYCSTGCQQAHWKSDHKLKCNDLSKRNLSQIRQPNCAKRYSGIALVLDSGTSKRFKRPGKVLFPYEEFVKLYNWDKPGFPPCGLLNCGNSCFANVVLQCLTYTRPLVAYLLEKGHHRECRRNDWCFLCVLECHVERASQSSQPFSPINILSRLPNIGGNLGYGRQEDAHEFMRFAIDTMQSACLDEFGGEKAVEPAAQETTLVQHIFGGHLQSQVMCTKCSNISNQFENMMDLTVEIHGDATSLEECLDQFTAKEWLQDDNMYKCDSCNDYVKAWKRLTIRRAPNILTIALKRFQSGRFGKLNKRINFPNTLDLSPYMSKGDGTDVYKLYAVVVHVDMLNASFFGHYICYIKDLQGDWFRFDDCKVTNVELDEVLSQGAYMLLYSRVSARPSCLRDITPPEEPQAIRKETDACTTENGDCHTAAELANGPSTSVYVQSESNGDVVNGGSKDVSSFHTSSGLGGVGYFQERSSSADDLEAATAIENVEESNSELCLAGLKQDCTATNGAAEGGACLDSMDSDSAISVAVSNCDLNVSTAMEIMEEQAGDSNSAMVVEDTVDEPKGNINSFSGETLSAKNHCRKRESSLHDSDEDDRNGATRAGATECY
ncbi:Ubiquitin carboxyl-terminal hydrolase 19 [Linum perenne]